MADTNEGKSDRAPPKGERKSLSERLLGLRLREIGIIMILLTAIPLVRPLLLPFPVDRYVQSTLDYLNSLPEGSVVMYHTETSLAQAGDVGTNTIAMQKALFSRPQKLKIVVYSTSPEGAASHELSLKDSKPEMFGKIYGVDYVIFGYLPGGLDVGHALVAGGIRSAYTVDNRGTPIDQIPMMQRISDYRDVSLFMTEYGLSDSCDPGLRQWTYKYGTPTILIPMSSGLTYAQQYYPNVVKGICGGSGNAAQMELITALPGRGVKYNDAKNLMYLYTDILMITGTLVYWYRRLRGKETVQILRDRDYGG